MSSLSSCIHVWFQQRQIGNLPPLYLSSRPSESRLKHMERHWNKVTQQYRDMSDADTLDVIMLQEELERGMSKEKRMAVQEYVFSVEDPERRAMLEIWLARFPGFMLRTDRLVDFGVADMRRKAVVLSAWQAWLKEWKLW
ncbi:18ecb2d5-d818-4e3e-9bef-4d06e8e36858 [Sclerotinia trifoliorum]|uniref:18ecb2d5-d818-4e3e-9bef-4d06e8e36858 n=1 Tax=Sclerotinia trifoliorum TaxID=28548 RepID=A0A8H2VTE1_9HELO|nr:18ecb2d5-d818-4e3e-9bef-4d06e8e36858 [Sclerotinia trifoliorum]